MEDHMRVESVDDEDINLMDTNKDDGTSSEQQVGEERDLTALRIITCKGVLQSDGGVLKKILVAGEGWELPEKDDQVRVHYTGTLTDGTEFDSSVSRNEPFEFTLGHGSVIKGWDVAVATMKKGEKAQLTLRHDYAYGENGNPPTIPPAATLIFTVELLSWVSVNDLSDEKDGSLMKKTVTEGDLNVWDKPKDVDLVTVKLSAKVQGSETWLEKDLEAEFKVEDGFFCPAVKQVVKSMKQGEAVHVKAGPKYAFGNEGRESCPPGSTLELDIELKLVKAVKTIDPDHKGLLVKTIIKDGAAYQTPNDQAEVLVSWTGKLSDGTEFEKVVERSYKIQDDAFPDEAVELAVLSMRSGEEAEIAVHDANFAYGATGLPGKVPPNELVSYHVILHSFSNGPETLDMDPAEKLEFASRLKGRGNSAMKAGRLIRARRLYDKVENILSMDQDFSEEQKAEKREVELSVSLNTAAAALKQGDMREVIKSCNKVLQKRANHVKALYRRSQAYVEQGDLFEAETDLKAALLVDPDNKDLDVAMKRLKQKAKKANKRDAKLFGAMFSKVGHIYEDVTVATGPIDEVDEVEAMPVDNEEGVDVSGNPVAGKAADAEGDEVMKDVENVSENV